MTDPKRFAARYPFELDDFQVEAIEALDSGESVLVAAPTGSGKTVVAEFAVERALDLGSKAFYTTQLKALSNQKFGDLVARYGAAKVGLLTGDNSINSEAPVVVMTTEVLRNMLYERSSTLTGRRRTHSAAARDAATASAPASPKRGDSTSTTDPLGRSMRRRDPEAPCATRPTMR